MAFRRVKRKDSFAQWFINSFGEKKFDLLINHKKNIELGLDIWTISRRSLTKIWFNCENKDYHEYCMPPDNYAKGYRCKYCARTKYVHPRDSLGQYLIDNYGEESIKLIWSDKNLKSPFKHSLASDVKMWFKCVNDVHGDKLRRVSNVIRGKFDCPDCVRDNNSSKLQKEVNNYIKSLDYKVNVEYDCTVIPINPKTKFKLPFDNEIEELKLIIEVHGLQHYNIINKGSKWIGNKTPEEYLYYIRLKDRYKRAIAISKGYNYLEIPYWSDDSKKSWKDLIDNKINNIKEGTTTENGWTISLI